MNPFPDPFDAVRRYLNRSIDRALERAIESVNRALWRAVSAPIRSLARQIEYFTSVLGQLSHAMANAVADSFRGPFARRMTAGEIALITKAFGKQPVSPHQVRFENGPGKQPLAMTAFLNGNPAITIGNTIYIKRSKYRSVGGKDLSKTPDGIELLLHEYTHVLQYARLGFAQFGRRYALEFEANGGDANKMYDYRSRSLHYRQELIEGQAAIVGDYAQQMALDPKKRDAKLVQHLQRKLAGTGIMGQ